MPTDIPTRTTPAGGPDLDKVQLAVVKALHQHWKLYLAEGVLLLVLGLIAIVVPASPLWR